MFQVLDTGTATEFVFAEALQKCRGYLLSIANAEMPGHLLPKCAASDLVQDSLEKALREKHRFLGGSLPELLAWLKGILNKQFLMRSRHFRAACRDTGREIEFETEYGIADRDPAPIERLITEERYAELDAALAELPEDARRIVLLRVEGNLTYPEIASRIGRSEEAVRKAFDRAVTSLKGLLES